MVPDHKKKIMKKHKIPSKHNNSKGSSLDPFLSKTVPFSSLPMYATEDRNTLQASRNFRLTLILIRNLEKQLKLLNLKGRILQL